MRVGRVKTIKIGNKNLSGVEARTLFNLKSANFEVVKENATSFFLFFLFRSKLIPYFPNSFTSSSVGGVSFGFFPSFCC